MSNALAFDDFKPFTTTCELRYKNAYLIYDRTGQIMQEMQGLFTNIAVAAATPQASQFTAEEGTFNLEIAATRYTTGRVGKHSEIFIHNCNSFFNSVIDRLEINIFTRIGLRCILKKEFQTEDEAKAALAAVPFPGSAPRKRFNIAEGPTEVLFRWEDKQIGAFVRLKAETTEVTINVQPEFRDVIPKFEKKLIGLTLDVDYYTVAPVEREKWIGHEWIPAKLRVIKKEVDGILQGA